MRSLNKWLPEAYVVTFYGNKTSREIAKAHEIYYGIPITRFVTKFNIILTTYETLLLESKSLSKIIWKAIIVDEGQKLKNHKSKIFNAAVKMSSRFRILLSSSPLQNNIDDLLNILYYIMPDKFLEYVPENLKQKYYKSIEELNRNHLKIDEMYVLEEEKDPEEYLLNEEEQVDPSNKDLIVKIKQAIQPNFLWRQQKDVLGNFASKKEIIIHTALTQRQRKIYKIILEKNFETRSLIDKNQPQRIISIENGSSVLGNLRLCCNHPFLLTHKYNKNLDPNENYELDQEDDNKKSDQELICEFHKDLINSSGKMKILDKLLTKLLSEKHKILIFSQFKLTLNILEDYFYLRKVKYYRVDGETQMNHRQTRVENFNKEDNSVSIFLLSTKAGCLGINFAIADTVIIFDSDINPQNDIQALSRAHRIGQKNNLVIYRLIWDNTWEEKMIEVASKKLQVYNIMASNENDAQEQEQFHENDVVEFNNILKHGIEKIITDNSNDSDNEISNDYIGNKNYKQIYNNVNFTLLCSLIINLILSK